MRFVFALAIAAITGCGNFSPAIKTSKPKPQDNSAHDKIEVWWIGHATVLIHLYDKWIFTDPNFSSRTGTVVKRLAEPGIALESIRPVDVILISHNHFDHLDAPSLERLAGSRHIFAPRSGFTYIPKGVAHIEHRVSDGYSHEEDGLKITAVPVAHFGGRLGVDNLWDGEPYTGYMIEYRGVTIFFAGDTGYDPQKFRDLRRFFKIDLALIPVGPAGGFGTGSGLGNAFHVNPYGALQIFRDCGATYMIPIHHSTFYRRGGREMEMIQDSIAISGRSEQMLLIEAGEVIRFEQLAEGKGIIKL